MNIDKERVIRYFQRIINICDRTTTGNISHQTSVIITTYSSIAGEIKKQCGEIMAYHNLLHIVELATKTTAGNVSHKIATIKGICSRSIEFIKGYGLYS